MHALLLAILAAGVGAKAERIDLVDFAQVVRFSDDAAMTTQPLDRGTNGWEAYLAPSEAGQAGSSIYMIGVEWETPRDVAEVNIEFRHAIANREKIQVQYWQEGWPAGAAKPAKGHWQTMKVADWWAGDRDVSFVLTPYNEEQPGKGAPDVRYRQTRRLRFLIGKDAPPPVRYIRVYGPGKATTASFELTGDAGAAKLLTATVENGYIVQGASGATTQSTLIEALPRTLSIRYAVAEAASPNKTVVKLQGEGAKKDQFAPAEAAKARNVKLAAVGVSISATPATKPGK